MLAERHDVPEDLVHINAGSELILRQIFQRLGQRVHVLTPTYALFPEIAASVTETRLNPEEDFRFDLAHLDIPRGTSLAIIVSPNNPSGASFDTQALPDLLRRHPQTYFLVDEAFIGFAGQPVASWVPCYDNLLVTRTFSKAHSLAGYRVGYAVLPEPLANDLNSNNDAYPLARPSQAAAIATLWHHKRVAMLQEWTRELASALMRLGATVLPTQTYFFLADFSPHSAEDIARRLQRRQIPVKPLADPRLGRGYMRVTTALPKRNQRFVTALGGRRSVAASRGALRLCPRRHDDLLRRLAAEDDRRSPSRAPARRCARDRVHRPEQSTRADLP